MCCCCLFVCLFLIYFGFCFYIFLTHFENVALVWQQQFALTGIQWDQTIAIHRIDGWGTGSNASNVLMIQQCLVYLWIRFMFLRCTTRTTHAKFQFKRWHFQCMYACSSPLLSALALQNSYFLSLVVSLCRVSSLLCLFIV